MNTETTPSAADRSTRPTAVTHSRTFIAGASIAGAAIVAGVVAAVMVALGSSAGAHTPSTPPPVPAPSHSVPAVPNNGADSNRGNGGGTVKPSQLPAGQVETIQRELAQLNYYEGPINGVMTPQTVQAITYLQRDADLPQNGEFNQVTYLALQNFLAHGNNQMAG